MLEQGTPKNTSDNPLLKKHALSKIMGGRAYTSWSAVHTLTFKQGQNPLLVSDVVSKRCHIDTAHIYAMLKGFSLFTDTLRFRRRDEAAFFKVPRLFQRVFGFFKLSDEHFG